MSPAVRYFWLLVCLVAGVMVMLSPAFDAFSSTSLATMAPGSTLMPLERHLAPSSAVPADPPYAPSRDQMGRTESMSTSKLQPMDLTRRASGDTTLNTGRKERATKSQGSAEGRPKPPQTVEWAVIANAQAQRPTLEQLRWKGAEDAAARNLMESVLDNQFVRDCGTRNLLVYSITREGNFGLFSVVNQLMAALALGLHMNRTVIFVTQGDEQWMYAPKEYCHDSEGTYQPWNCYFMPITNCDVRRDHNVGKPNGHRYTRLSLLETSAVRGARIFSLNVVFGRSLFGSMVHIPPLESAEEMQRLAVFAAYLFRPVPWIVEYKERLKHWLGLDQVPHYVATHIRRTDKAHEEFLYNSVEYLDLLTPLPHRHAFVMTDDPEVVTSLQQASDQRHAGFHFYYSPQLRPKEGATPAMLNTTGASIFPVIQHAVEFLADCLIAAEAQFFLGYCGSNADRILPELIAARTKRYTMNATSLLLAEGRCRYWARDWARDPTLFNKHTTHTRDVILAALEDEMLSDKEIEAIKSYYGRRGDEGGAKVASLVQRYEQVVRDPVPRNRIPMLLQLKEELNYLMVLTIPKLRAPVECQSLGTRTLKGKFVFRRLFEEPELSESDMTALLCLLQNSTSSWEDHLAQLVRNHQEAVQASAATAVASTKMEINQYWCILFPTPLTTHCATAPYAEALLCGQKTSQKFCANFTPSHSIVKLRWKMKKASM